MALEEFSPSDLSDLTPVILEDTRCIYVRRVSSFEAVCRGMLPIELAEFSLQLKKEQEKNEDDDEPPTAKKEAEQVDRTLDFQRFAAAVIVAINWGEAVVHAKFKWNPAAESEFDITRLTIRDLTTIQAAACGFHWSDLAPLVEHWTWPLLARTAVRGGCLPSDLLKRTPQELALDVAALLTYGGERRG